MSLPKRDGVQGRYYLIQKPDTNPEVLEHADQCIQDVLDGTAKENHSGYPVVVRNQSGTPFLPSQLLERYLSKLPLKGFPYEEAVTFCDALRRLVGWREIGHTLGKYIKHQVQERFFEIGENEDYFSPFPLCTAWPELTELEGKISNVNNYCIAVKEKGDDIVFLRKIVKGGADKSYGIQVAKLAGVPDLVIERAKEIVEELSDEDVTAKVSEIAVRERNEKKKPKAKKYDEVDIAQMSLFDTVKDDDVLEELKNLDVGNMTPIDALNTIYRLQNKLKNRW